MFKIFVRRDEARELIARAGRAVRRAARTLQRGGGGKLLSEMPRHLLAAEEPPRACCGARRRRLRHFRCRLLRGDADARAPRLLIGSIVVSCALHVAAAAALLTSATALPEFGVLQNPSETFSLSTTQTVVLESIVTEAVATTAAASAAMPEGTVQSVDAEPEPLKADDVPVETEPPPQAIKAAEVTPEVAETPEEPLEVVRGSGEPAETVEAKPEPAQEQESQEQAEREERSKKRRELAQRQRSQRAGRRRPVGARERRDGGGERTRLGEPRQRLELWRARALQGRPQQAVGPRPARRRQGLVRRVAVGRAELCGAVGSSGNAALDDAALAAVRRSAPFGPPPPDVLPSELRFSIRITFR